jgi:SAM-dependent methyltransferase
MDMKDSWQSGNAYDQFMGRWSALVASKFLSWLAVPPAVRWLEVGCGTGSLTRLILETSRPRDIVAVDSSGEFISYAQQQVDSSSVHFMTGLAQSLALGASSCDAVVSGLLLNFVPQPAAALSEMRRVTRPGGKIGVFVWDYEAGMAMLRHFWDAAVELDKNALDFDEGRRFPICQERRLEALFQESGMKQIETTAVQITTRFENFDDYWQPFLGGVGPAPSYTMSLAQANRKALEEKLRQSLRTHKDGSIFLLAKAWAVKGIT